MKIGHLVIGLLVLLFGGAPLGFLPGDLWMVPVLGLLPLGLLTAFGFFDDVMDRSLGEALFGRDDDAAQDDALYRALLAGEWGRQNLEAVRAARRTRRTSDSLGPPARARRSARATSDPRRRVRPAGSRGPAGSAP